jgi:hypothetical protein
VARIFGTSWPTVFRAVEAAVQWGRRHMSLRGICAIGVDEGLAARSQVSHGGLRNLRTPAATSVDRPGARRGHAARLFRLAGRQARGQDWLRVLGHDGSPTSR